MYQSARVTTEETVTFTFSLWVIRAPPLNAKSGGHPVSAVGDCIFNTSWGTFSVTYELMFCVLFTQTINTAMTSCTCCSYGYILRATQQNVFGNIRLSFYPSSSPENRPQSTVPFAYLPGTTKEQQIITFNYQYCLVNATVTCLNTTAVWVTGDEGYCNPR